MIQVYETIIEFTWKIMQRWIEINADLYVAQKPKRELFRIARECGLITDAAAWWGFYDARNKTSHVYREETADEVYGYAKRFGGYLDDFINRLAERL